MITFGATLVSHVNIQKHINGKYAEHKVAIVKYDKNNVHDDEVLKTLEASWGEGNLLQQLPEIINHARWLDIFFVTQQEKKFSRLEANKILGVSCIRNLRNGTKTERLQINPKYKYRQPSHHNSNLVNQLAKAIIPERQYKGIGKALDTYVRQNCQGPYTTEPLKEAVGFWKKQGYKFVNDDETGLMIHG